MPFDRWLEGHVLRPKLAERSRRLGQALGKRGLAEVAFGTVEAIGATAAWRGACASETHVAVRAARGSTDATANAGGARRDACAFETLFTDLAAHRRRSAQQGRFTDLDPAASAGTT